MSDTPDLPVENQSQPETAENNPEMKTGEVVVEPIQEVNQNQDDLSQLLPAIMAALCLDSANTTEQELRPQNAQLQSLLSKVIMVLKEKCRLCANLERQNAALELQTNSLKDVISITKNLLSIRNTEVVHLHVNIKTMEEKINFERERHNLMLSRMAEAIKLNESLKTEYQTQLGLFTDLRARYEEKVKVLERENQRLVALVKGSATATDQQ